MHSYARKLYLADYFRFRQNLLPVKFSTHILSYKEQNANFSIKNWIEEQELFWFPKIFNKKKVSYWDIFKNNKKE